MNRSGARGVLGVVMAMITTMFCSPAAQADAAFRENVAALRRHGVTVLDPAVGRLTGKDSGPGRLPEPEAIWAAERAALEATPTIEMKGLMR